MCGIGTQPDRPAGRHRKLTATPVAGFAEDRGFNVNRIPDINEQNWLTYLKSLDLDFIIVAAFGQLLREKVLSIPQQCCLNLHASLLPHYRGASPLQAAILHGDKQSGISFMQMERGLDTGPVYYMPRLELHQEETTTSLEFRLAQLGGDHIITCLEGIVEGRFHPIPQDPNEASYAPKIKKSDGQVNWELSADQLERMSRAYAHWPMLWYNLKTGRKTRRLQFTKVTVIENRDNIPAGTILQADKHAWIVACGKNALRIDYLIPSGGHEMTGPEFLRGARLEHGTVLNSDE